MFVSNTPTFHYARLNFPAEWLLLTEQGDIRVRDDVVDLIFRTDKGVSELRKMITDLSWQIDGMLRDIDELAHKETDERE